MTSSLEQPVVIHYFEFPGFGRAGAIKLLLIDADVEFSNKLYQFDSWPQHKAELQSSGKSPAGTVPVVQVGQRFLSQTPAIVQYLSLKLGYNTQDAWEVYQLIAAIDLAEDAIEAFYRKEEDKARNNLAALNKLLEGFDNQGPYVLGKRAFYADFVLFSILTDIKISKDELTKLYPRLMVLYEAVQKRERINEWLQKNPHLLKQ